jgi:hypothetical protein
VASAGALLKVSASGIRSAPTHGWAWSSSDPLSAGRGSWFCPTRQRKVPACRGIFLDRAASWQRWAVSRGDARRRACPRMPAGPKNAYPRCTRDAYRRVSTGNTTSLFAGLFSPSPLTDSNRRLPPYHAAFGLRLHGQRTALGSALSLQLSEFLCPPHPFLEAP